MADLSNLNLMTATYTPQQVWDVVDRIPNTATTHWDIFGKVVLPAVQNLLLREHPAEAHDIALAWAQRSPRFDQKTFDTRWKQLLKSPMVMPGMATLEAHAESAAIAEASAEAAVAAAQDDLMRQQFDALRQACAVIAGKLRREWLKGELARAKEDGWPLTSAVGGKFITVNNAAACYDVEWPFERLVIAFCSGLKKMPGDFKFVKATTGGSRFANADDAELFTACHEHHAKTILRLCAKDESVAALKPAEWSLVREHLLVLKAELDDGAGR